MNNSRLVKGNIAKALIKLAIPIMGTSFVQMAYNMTDMIWIGKVGSSAMAAVGTAGFFSWLSVAFILVSRIGAEVCVAQSIGRSDIDSARSYVKASLQLNIFLAVLYSAFLLIFRQKLIGFFNLGDEEIIEKAISYLVIIAFGMIFYFPNQLFSGIFNGYGDSKTPFIINSIGLISNIILDPVLIFGLGPFPKLEVQGAAIATITAQFIVTIFFMAKLKDHPLFKKLGFKREIDLEKIRQIARTGLPVALQEGLFASFAMVLARIIAQWGPVPIAVQKVGAQIEAISWMTAGGFSTALAAFVGQNYGAKKWERITKGYFIAFAIMASIGVGATFLLYFGAEPIFAIFLAEEEALKQGIVYLKVLSIAQLFMCTEIITAGAFNGLGKTLPPALVGIIFTGLRIPTALIISQEGLLGLKGVWWSITVSCVLKGIILPTLFVIFMLRDPDLRTSIKIPFITGLGDSSTLDN